MSSFSKLYLSHSGRDIEDADDTVTTSHSEHVTFVAEIYRVASTTEVFNLETGREIGAAIEYLDFI